MNNERRMLVDQAGGGDAGDRPTLVGEYTFSNLNTNVGLTDEDFSETHPHYFFARRTTPLARQEPKDKSAAGGFGGNGSSTPKTPCQRLTPKRPLTESSHTAGCNSACDG